MALTFSRSSPRPSSARPPASRKRTPSARAQPMPPSLVALPPMAMEMSVKPVSRAWRISSPVP